jgi:hypothetical protein
MPFFIIPPDERKDLHVEISESDSSDDEAEEVHVRQFFLNSL